MKKHIIVIGGGIAGLSAGVYALKCGFDVTILESHSIAGGNCTSWKRKDYLFEGGMHWLTGSDPKQPLHRSWRYIGALSDAVPVSCPEPYMEYNYKGTPIRMFRNIGETEKHWLSLSPADEKEIRALFKNMRRIQTLAMPVTDLRGVKVTKKQHPPLSLLFTGLSAMRLMHSLSKITRNEYISRFTHAGIRAFLRASTEEKSGIMPLVFSMGIISSGDGGFPKGGSLPFVKRIVDQFEALGGRLMLKTRAERVMLKNNRAEGVLVNGEVMPCDAVIVTADTMTVEVLFDVPLHAPWLDTMRKATEPTMVTLLSLGVNADLSKYPHGLILELASPIKLGPQTYAYLNLNNYANDRDYSPAGKSALTVMLGGDTYDFWKKAKEEGRYKEEKERIAGEVIAAMTAQMPEMEGNVEVCDVATPLTYERYCGNWKGSWMTEMTGSMNMKAHPAVIDGLNGVYFAGQRMMPPGGLPVALMTGRSAVQYLCRDTDTVFVSEA